MSDYSVTAQDELINLTVITPSPATVITVATTEAGPAGRINSVAVDVLAPGATPTVQNTGTQEVADLVFGIPQNQVSNLSIGTVQVVPPDTPAAVTNTGTPGDAVLNFFIPVEPFGNLDGGYPDSVFGGIPAVDGGGV